MRETAVRTAILVRNFHRPGCDKIHCIELFILDVLKAFDVFTKINEQWHD